MFLEISHMLCVTTFMVNSNWKIKFYFLFQITIMYTDCYLNSNSRILNGAQPWQADEQCMYIYTVGWRHSLLTHILQSSVHHQSWGICLYVRWWWRLLGCCWLILAPHSGPVFGSPSACGETWHNNADLKNFTFSQVSALMQCKRSL